MTRILILEDDYELAAGWSAAFRRAGMQADICMSSSEAIGYVGYGDYDLYIVDLLIEFNGVAMGDSGRVFLRHLQSRAEPDQPDDLIIGVSGFKPLGDAQTARSIFEVFDVSNVLIKPFEPAVLVDLAVKLLGKSENGRKSS